MCIVLTCSSTATAVQGRHQLCCLHRPTGKNCCWAFTSLLTAVCCSQQPPLVSRTCSPLFVTWSKVSRFGDYRLRGCIGTLQPRHLHTALREYALTRYTWSCMCLSQSFCKFQTLKHCMSAMAVYLQLDLKRLTSLQCSQRQEVSSNCGK